MRNNIYFSIALVFIAMQVHAQRSYPHILVNDGDKSAIHQKIEKQEWAKKIYDTTVGKVSPYVERHQTDPEWILSRYLMNRVVGKRYTHAYDNGNGQTLTRYSGDAPVPTVRVSTHLRNPVTVKGSTYIKPSIEELIPYDTARFMWVKNPETNEKDLIDPQQLISIINGEINELAFNAAVIYWLTGEEKYAKFAADILDQWAKGAFYQEPIVGACRTGFLDIQTLGDNRYQTLILAYDFVFPYMKKKGYDLWPYQKVFEKFASTLTFRGFWNNNWYAAVSSTLVYAALSLEDVGKRDYYLQFFLERDTINGSCGQLAMPSTVEKWLTHDGHWKEPGGYHNFPVSNLVVAALALEKNGYDVFRKFPALFEATYAMLKYSFPNLMVSAFGDTGRASQSPATLEIGLAIALKYNRMELPGMMSAMNALINGGLYSREQSGLLGLLTYLPELPNVESAPYEWPRSGELEFARFYLQRNGMDTKHGLMYGVQGASYNHNHCNGMAMELYGYGEIVGIDAGIGPNYEHPLHVNYFSQWAAHNTVVSAGASSSVPFSGSAGRKNIGQIELAAMEPMPDKSAVSPNYSFTDTRYKDISTNTNQLRTMAIVRTSETTGYYVDIYRSDNEVSNDYVYHNIGDGLSFLSQSRESINTKTTEYPRTERDFPGFRYFTDVEKLENHKGPLVGLFPIVCDEGDYSFMQVVLPASDNKVYFKAKSPAVKTAGRHYNNKALPVFTIRAEKEAWSEPFIAVFEPFHSDGKQSVSSVEKIAHLCNENNTVLKVSHVNGSAQMVFQGNDDVVEVKNNQMAFSGHFGIVSLNGKQVNKLYLGQGRLLSYGNISLLAQHGNTSAEVNVINAKSYNVTCNEPVILEINGAKAKRAVLKSNGSTHPVSSYKSKNGMQYIIPAGKDMLLVL
jgi:hypothetical protein